MQEKEIQQLIADYPWLLNFNYENIPGFDNKGQEVIIPGGRFDLILRDRITKRPVIVEFKATSFNRENIGQVLEYRARCAIEITQEDSKLKSIFDDQLLAPLLVLVVPQCSLEGKIACNLAGIEVYEYETDEVKKINDPSNYESFATMAQKLKEGLPVNFERHEKVLEIYDEIAELLTELKLEEGFKPIKSNKTAYYYPLENFFINIWLFGDNEVSIGIYEDIFESFTEIKIDYYSKNTETLNSFREKLVNLSFKEKNIPDVRPDDDYDEAYITFKENKVEFISNVKKILRPYIEAYRSIMKDKLNSEV